VNFVGTTLGADVCGHDSQRRQGVPVPEPAAMLALSVSAFGLVHRIRRRRQRAAADEPANP